nr:MAG TPA: hypothetical protein [Caudoviricetes sp.]
MARKSSTTKNLTSPIDIPLTNSYTSAIALPNLYTTTSRQSINSKLNLIYQLSYNSASARRNT